MTTAPLMPKATAVWLVENTALTFVQIAEFCAIHPLEVQAIADGEGERNVRGLSPVVNGQLTDAEIKRCEADGKLRLQLRQPVAELPKSKRNARYTPLNKRRDKPSAVLWMLRNCPTATDAQISKLIGTTKTTIASLRNKTHWNYQALTPLDPVFAGMCTQSDLNALISKITPATATPEPDEAEDHAVYDGKISPFADIRQPKSAEDARALAEQLFGQSKDTSEPTGE